MKIYYPKDADGNIVGLRTPEKYVYDANGDSLTTKLTELNSKTQPNRCILTDNYGTITSDFGYTYDDISEMLANNDWDKYIHDLDYIKVKLSNGHWFTLRFNINTYLNNYSTQPNIDMISDEIEYEYVYIWENDCENNNGTSSTKIPLMRMPDLQAFLNTTLYNRIPSGLKSHIVDKTGYFPYRYTNGETLTDDNKCNNGNLGKVWLPFEFEIFGRYDMSTPLSKTYGASYLKQYPCFQHSPYGKRFWTAADNTASLSSVFSNWWTGSPNSGDSNRWVYVNGGGYAHSLVLNNNNSRVPLCIRFR